MNWSQNLNRLKSEHAQIAEMIKGKSIAYIDIPNHYNTGDLLIYLGTEQFFINHNVNVKYRAIQNSIDKNKLNECELVLIHGGGNFGDIYLQHQIKRERFIESISDKEIIFLPQSIQYDNNDNLLNSITCFKKLNNVTIFTRDQYSFDIAKKLTENVHMMPDMAHSLHPMIEESEVSCLDKNKKKKLNLKRKDKESVEDKRSLIKRTFDWSDLCDGNDLLLHHLVKLHSRMPISRRIVLKVWFEQINCNVTKAVNYVEKYDVVYTDRLHGFILAYLLGKEVVLFDNSYKKIDRYLSFWFLPCCLINKG